MGTRTDGARECRSGPCLGMTNLLVQLRLWLSLARPPLFAVALGVCVGVMRDSPIAAGAAGLAIVVVLGSREYWRPNSWVPEGDR